MNNKIKCLFAFFIFIFASNTFAGNIATYKEAKAFEANLYRNYSCQGEAVDFCDDCSYEALRLRNYIDEENAILYLVRETNAYNCKRDKTQLHIHYIIIFKK